MSALFEWSGQLNIFSGLVAVVTLRGVTFHSCMRVYQLFYYTVWYVGIKSSGFTACPMMQKYIHTGRCA